MLKKLRLHNIILVEDAHIDFSPKLNVITGETGSGKSAILEALRLLLGERSDASIIRNGSEKAFVEGTFDHLNDSVLKLLEEAGVDHDTDEELSVRREIQTNGKNRCFINQQQVQLAFLRKIGQNLIRIAGQHASQDLFSLEAHRNLVDLHGNLTDLLKRFKESYQKTLSLSKELEQIIQSEAQRVREIDHCQKELQEIDEAQLKEGEEESLFAEYSLLSNSKELLERVNEIDQLLLGDRNPILIALQRQRATFDAIVQLNPKMQEIASSYQNALLELEEVAYCLRRSKGHLLADPDRLEVLNDRLSLINKLKRKYGESLEEIFVFYQKTQHHLAFLEKAEERIEELQKHLQESQNQTDQLAQELSEKRKNAAKLMDTQMTQELQSLNMTKAVFSISITEQSRTLSGDDKVEFYLQPNLGERSIPIREGVSGGEVSRVLLALYVLLAGKESVSTLIFDEIDANIGGETASLIGEKLKGIGEQHQVICVTHFPQVARHGHHHLQISKQEKSGRTMTLITLLDINEKVKELNRMAGHTTT